VTQLPQRKSLRLKDFDYSTDGAYFVTICTRDRQLIFGNVIDHAMNLNHYGYIVDSVWRGLSERFTQIKLDEFVVMPNHVHGIISVVGAVHEPPLHHELPIQTKRRNMLLPKMVGYFKMNSAKRINQLRNTPGTPVWQRNYYERVIRDEHELQVIQKYIADNPVKWNEDPENNVWT